MAQCERLHKRNVVDLTLYKPHHLKLPQTKDQSKVAKKELVVVTLSFLNSLFSQMNVTLQPIITMVLK
jgi:hypothetical protein